MKKIYLKIVLYAFCPLLVAGFVYVNGYPDDQSIFMKGRVAEVHAFMEDKCMKCHVPWNGVSNSACIQCHVDDRHYLNTRLDKAVAGTLRCFDCHPEHRGRSYDPLVAGY